MGIRSDVSVKRKRDELHERMNESDNELEKDRLKDKLETLDWVIGNTHEL